MNKYTVFAEVRRKGGRGPSYPVPFNVVAKDEEDAKAEWKREFSQDWELVCIIRITKTN